MSIKTRLEKLEGGRGKRSAAEYVIDSLDDYYRVRKELGCTLSFLSSLEEVEASHSARKGADPYEQFLLEGRIVETPDFQELCRQGVLNVFIRNHLGSGELPEF